MDKNLGQQIRKFIFQGGNPATVVLIAVNVITWFAVTILGPGSLAKYLIFNGASWPFPAFWSVVTWPLVAMGHPIWLLFALMWAFWIGGSLERSWGTARFLGFFFGTCALTAATLWIGGRLLGMPVFLSGLFTAMAAPTVAWALLNPRQQVGLYFGLLQVPAVVLAWLTAVIVWFENGPPVLGLFALSGCAFAWWYVTQGRDSLLRVQERNSIHRAARQFRPENGERDGGKSGVDPARWLKERQEKKRLEDIMRRSGFTDDDR